MDICLAKIDRAGPQGESVFARISSSASARQGSRRRLSQHNIGIDPAQTLSSDQNPHRQRDHGTCSHIDTEPAESHPCYALSRMVLWARDVGWSFSCVLEQGQIDIRMESSGTDRRALASGEYPDCVLDGPLTYGAPHGLNRSNESLTRACDARESMGRSSYSDRPQAARSGHRANGPQPASRTNRPSPPTPSRLSRHWIAAPRAILDSWVAGLRTSMKSLRMAGS